MNNTPDNEYFEWLYSQIGSVKNRNPGRSYWELCRQLHSKPFVWFVPNDDNRAMDGMDLRYEWAGDRSDIPDHWFALECSMLEMMIALARRAAFETSESPVEWFYRFLENLQIRQYTDDIYEIAIQEEVDEVLDRVINRTYDYNGLGGLFPLHSPQQDQRDVELWYQLAAYILEGV